ncbi:hypothetical protein GETHLI_23290 [Geothrix limicola]|uniref:Carbohydrate-binding domain-containing protein n=1 Tax=Geothrix limicola TaxID=2927978 RepID=A0ABQ5QGP0_9BACT|nr:carbohydrate-binding family 9-like protein [Geothrix limicola]GLH73827.1 hypothetical protein GETHLI_23290 [Geothrix limicola]
MERYGIPEDQLAHYTCLRAPEAFAIDGNLDKAAWRAAPKSHRFVDLVSGEPGFFDTRVACLWDERALYVGFWIQEPQVRATLTERDSFIWFDNDVEVFFGGEDCYYEFEVNALNTIYEVFYIYQDALKRGSRFDRPEFDLYTRDVDVLCGYQDASRIGKHPRGKRWAFMDWDFPGLQSAVQVQGRLNDPKHLDQGWTVELAFPWEGMKALFANRPFPPREGDTLRASFSRFEALRYHGKTVQESPGWALNAHGVYDSHIPECFSVLHFSGQVAR